MECGTPSNRYSAAAIGVVRTVRCMAHTLKVWIDQDLCTGDGLCQDHAPDVFVMLEDGIAYVKQDGVALNDPGGSQSLAVVPKQYELDVIAAADLCPGECIFIEIPALVEPLAIEQ